jgi:hypothetical protein
MKTVAAGSWRKEKIVAVSSLPAPANYLGCTSSLLQLHHRNLHGRELGGIKDLLSFEIVHSCLG